MDIKSISPRFAVTGQVVPEDVAGIAASGFKAIVCNRPDDEVPGQPPAARIGEEAARHGLAFACIPVTPGAMTDDQARALAAFLDQVEGPVLGYCRSGARSGSLWERAQVVVPSVN